VADHHEIARASTTNGLPVAPTLGPTLAVESVPHRVALVDRRVVMVSGIAIALAAAATLIARILTAMIGLVTNLAFYGRVSTAFVSPAAHHLGLDHRVLQARGQLAQLLDCPRRAVGVAVEPRGLGEHPPVADPAEQRAVEAHGRAQLLGGARDHHAGRGDLAQPGVRLVHAVEPVEAALEAAAQQLELEAVELGGLGPRLVAPERRGDLVHQLLQ